MKKLELDSIIDLSSEIGADIKLVQGAGGNVSLKCGNDFWIKVSGAWLADARRHSIFVRLGLNEVLSALAKGNADLSTCLLDNTGLRPSIETSLHAIMRQAVVVHVHSINSISWGVRIGGKIEVAKKLNGLSWDWVDYYRPGFPLTHAVQSKLNGNPNLAVLLLANHGLVVAAETAKEAHSLLKEVDMRLLPQSKHISKIDIDKINELAKLIPPGSRLPSIQQVHLLAQDENVMAIARTGALYPDHVVFLGASTVIIQLAEKYLLDDLLAKAPYFVIIAGLGVVLGSACSASAEAMLECLAILAPTLPSKDQLRFLNSEEIFELINWDAEKARQNANKNRKNISTIN